MNLLANLLGTMGGRSSTFRDRAGKGRPCARGRAPREKAWLQTVIPARPGPFSARYQYPDHKIYRKFNVLELFGMTLIGAGVGEQSEGREQCFPSKHN